MTWAILSGRRVAHWIHKFEGGRIGTECGQTRNRFVHQTREASDSTRRCEQCQMALLTGIYGSFHKFFMGFVPLEVRSRRRRLWREHLGLPVGPRPSRRRLFREERKALRDRLLQT